MDTEECIICLESDGCLIRPCHCSARVHAVCLRQWWETSNPPRLKTCVACNRAFAQTVQKTESALYITGAFILLLSAGCIFMVMFFLTRCLISEVRELGKDTGIATCVFFAIAGVAICIGLCSGRLRMSEFFVLWRIQRVPLHIRVELADTNVDVHHSRSKCVSCDRGDIRIRLT